MNSNGTKPSTFGVHFHFDQFIRRIEAWQISSSQAIVVFLTIIWIRNVSETLLEGRHVVMLQLVLRDWLVDILHVAASWTMLFIFLSAGLAFFSRRTLMRTNRVVLALFPLIWLPPLWDAFWGSSGEIIYQQDFQHFTSSFFGLFNPFMSVSYVTPGVRVEIAGALLLTALYIVTVRESCWWQRLLAGAMGSLWVYCSIFLIGFLPAIWFGLLSTDQVSLLGRSILGVEYTLSTLLWYLPLMLIGLPLWLRSSSPHVWSALLMSLRPSRILVYLSICNISLLSASTIGLVGWDWLNPYDIGSVLLLNLSLVFAFISMTVLNDLYDTDIDAVSNRERPLINGLIGRDDFTLLGWVCGVLALLLSVAINEVAVILMLTILVLGILYSAPPMRLRCYVGLGHGALAVIAACVYLFGATPIFGNLAFQQVDHNQWLSLITLFFIGVHFKDIKDVKGDMSAGVSTLSSLLGPVRAYWVTGILMIVTILGLVAMGNLANSLLSWAGLSVFCIGWWTLRDGEKTFWVMLAALGLVFFPVS